MKINYDVASKPPKKRGKERSEEVKAILDFIKSNHSNMVFEYESIEECRRRYSSIYVSVKRENMPIIIKRSVSKIYITRIKED